MNSIVGNMKDAMDFRLFLRNYFYPKNQQFIQNNLYSYIQGIDDIDFVSDSYMYRLKCKYKKCSDQDMNGMNIESALVNTLSEGNVNNEIYSSNISDNNKVSFSQICSMILSQIHLCGYLKALYNMIWFPINSTTFMMELYL